MNDRDIKALIEAAEDAEEVLGDLIMATSDPGSNAIITRQRLRQELFSLGSEKVGKPERLTMEQLTDRVLGILDDVAMLEVGVDGETQEIPAGEPAVDVARAIVEGLIEQQLLRSHPSYIELDRQIIEVLQYVSCGRGHLAVDPVYPDATARAALGRIELLPGGSGLLVEPYLKPEGR